MGRWISLFLLFFSMGYAEESEEIEFCGEIRVNMVKGWDKLLTWTLMSKMKPFALAKPLIEKAFSAKNPFFEMFKHDFGYYSEKEPIVGVVTEEKKHIDVTNELLVALGSIKNNEHLEFSSDEVLAKVLAYRNLKKGMEIVLPNHQTFIVDQVLDLWKGMPAFGLVPKNKRNAPPILLFRGTDMNFVSEKGWASILSDLDITGPGHATFLKAQDTIHAWLEKVSSEYEPARLLGYSLGGSFVFYTAIYEGELVSQRVASKAFNAPGVSMDVLKKWEEGKKVPLEAYVYQGDIVSQMGYFFSDVWEATLEKSMDIIQAHLTLLTSEPSFKLTAVDVQAENKSRQ